MKTMFVVHDKNAKKRFQKPNILRKRSKPSPKTATHHESFQQKTQCSELKLEKVSLLKHSPVNKLISTSPEENKVNDELSFGELYQIDGNLDDRSLAVTCEVLTNNNEKNVFETTINVESFINTSDMEQMVSEADVENELNSRIKGDWNLDFINDAQEIIIEDIDGSHLGSLRLASNKAPVATTTALEPQAQLSRATAPTRNITLEYMNYTTNFKCDVPNCSKRFRSEQALSKHKSIHSKVNGGNRANKQVLIECPVKKQTSTGEEPCGVFCSSKQDIVKHLNESHDPEDAMYICSECGRRFYWAAGLRGHARTHGAGGAGAGGGAGGGAGKAPLACGWAGCSRVFRQPCRLREHMRAHTGDKPYPCNYPGCGWSFRTASKLVRHARRHTGERRHACEQCGRAFRRREHLRDHHARHHAHAHAHAEHAEKPSDVKLEVSVEEVLPAPPAPAPPAPPAPAGDVTPPHRPDVETFLVSVDPVVLSGVGGAAGGTRGVCGRAARTHCAWPFQLHDQHQHQHEHEHIHQQHIEQYVLEEDGQVEMSEGSESNIYTIRSDLFLHGNVLNNEDSEQMGAAAAAGEITPPLLDAPPTTDLMQEELMYTDAAVDESPFRVFLLSGDDLS